LRPAVGWARHKLTLALRLAGFIGMRYDLSMKFFTTRLHSREPLRTLTVKLTLTGEKTLQSLGRDASALLGWTISSSAIVRALIRHAGKQPAAWIANELLPLIEEEIAQGRVWGSKKR